MLGLVTVTANATLRYAVLCHATLPYGTATANATAKHPPVIADLPGDGAHVAGDDEREGMVEGVRGGSALLGSSQVATRICPGAGLAVELHGSTGGRHYGVISGERNTDENLLAIVVKK